MGTQKAVRGLSECTHTSNDCSLHSEFITSVGRSPVPPRYVDMRHQSGGRLRLALRATASILTLCLLCVPVAASAQKRTAFTFERGSGDGTGLWRAGILRDWRDWMVSENWKMIVAWEVQVGMWAAHSGPASHRPVAELGVTPVVRLERESVGNATLYFEGAVGAHLISRNRVHERLDMSSAYQFGDHLGVGVRLGQTPWLEVTFRHQHLSNASTVPPNDGVNFNIIRVVYFLQ